MTLQISYEGYYFAPITEFLRVLVEHGDLGEVEKLSAFETEAVLDGSRHLRIAFPAIRYKSGDLGESMPPDERALLNVELAALATQDAVVFIWDCRSEERSAGSVKCWSILRRDLQERGLEPCIVVGVLGECEGPTLEDVGNLRVMAVPVALGPIGARTLLHTAIQLAEDDQR